jgi:hypothetical protein
VWWGVDQALGRGIAGQLLSVGLALLAGFSVYAGGVLAAGVPEAWFLRDRAQGVLRRRR